MCSIVLDGIKQHEVINGYNNYNKNNKSCYELHKISTYGYIALSIQKEVNTEAKNGIFLIGKFEKKLTSNAI